MASGLCVNMSYTQRDPSGPVQAPLSGLTMWCVIITVGKDLLFEARQRVS